MNTWISRALICIAAALALATSAARADDLLLIDLSTPNEITISATAGLSAVDATGPDSIGVYFENFFGGAGSLLSETDGLGDLTNAENPTDNSPAIYRAFSSDPGLNIWSFSSDSSVSFTAGSLAFTGSATWTVTPTLYAEMLAGTTSGDLYFPADSEQDVADGAQLLGTWAVIPEPGSLALLGVGLGMTLLRRRR